MRNHTAILGFVALAALTTFVNCAKKNATDERACSGAQALQANSLKGSSLPPKTVALTFDDGPTVRTKVLSQYLKAEGIEAAFFVNGKMFGEDADLILTQVIEDGHIIGNHTETHRSLTGLNGDPPGQRMPEVEMIAEIEQTDMKLADKYVPTKRFLFRPPFGDWDAQANTTLSASTMNKYVGPIKWDVGDKMGDTMGDWDCWQKHLTVQQCGDLYITEIKRSSRGIVLMHDPYYDLTSPNQEGTVEMVQYMVPILKAEGFTFVRVDKVPEIEKLLPPLDPQATPPGQNPGGPGGDPAPVGDDDPCK